MLDMDFKKSVLDKLMYVSVLPRFVLEKANEQLNTAITVGTIYEIMEPYKFELDGNVIITQKHDLLVKITNKWQYISVKIRQQYNFEKWLISSDLIKENTNLTYFNNQYVNKRIQKYWTIWLAALDTTISG